MRNLPASKLYELEKKLSEYAGPDRVVSSIELQKELEKTKEEIFVIPTGMPTLDRLLEGGVEAGELFVVSGPTDEGKSTMLMSITRNMARKEVKTAWFTMEITPRQFIKKIGSRGELPLFYLPNEAYEAGEDTLNWIQERIIEARAKYGVQVVFIDHLHQIFSLAKTSQKRGNMSWEMGDLVGRLKNMAISLNIVIFLIAHTKDDPEGSAREPRKEDIRDSGLISRLADEILMVWRVKNDAELDGKRRTPTDEHDTKAKVRLMKNRRVGKYGTWFMHHDNYHLLEVSLDDYGDA